MKRFLFVMMTVIAGVMFAACGGHGNDNHANEDGHENDGHGHSHEGVEHVMGTKDAGDYKVIVKHIGNVEKGAEVVFEIMVKKDGKDIKDAKVTIRVGQEGGEDLTPSKEAAWSDGESVYDGHLMMPKELPEGAHVYVKLSHDGNDHEVEFELEGHDHDGEDDHDE